MTQTFAKLKIVTPKPMALQLGRPRLQLKAQLRFTANLSAASPILISPNYAISFDMNALYLGTAAPLMDGAAAVGVALYPAHSDHVHPTDTTRAPLASPALTGVPTAPTAAANNNSTQLATTAYLDGKLAVANGIATLDGSGKLTAAQIPASLIGAVVYQGTWNATTNSPALASGVGTKGFYYKVATAGTTSIDGIASWNIADTIIFDGTTWDKIDGITNEVISVAGRTGVVTLAVADVSGAAPLASPTFTGTPAAPTAAALDNTTKIATTAYADLAVGVEKARGLAAEALLAPLASPALTGTPTSPTATAGTNTTQVATTAFVIANAGAINPALFRSYIAGLGLSTAGASATFGIGIGVAVDSTNAGFMSLASAYTKTTGAWAVGTATGSFDGTGPAPSATSGWYHVFLIKRLDTNVVDVLTSNSATAPTMPANYTLFRRIGSMKTNGSFQWILFHQLGDEFLWDTAPQDANNVTLTATAASLTLSVPTGVQVWALAAFAGLPTGSVDYLITSLDTADVLPSSTAFNAIGGASTFAAWAGQLRTNTSAQIRWRASSTTTGSYMMTFGWIDRRGRDA